MFFFFLNWRHFSKCITASLLLGEVDVYSVWAALSTPPPPCNSSFRKAGRCLGGRATPVVWHPFHLASLRSDGAPSASNSRWRALPEPQAGSEVAGCIDPRVLPGSKPGMKMYHQQPGHLKLPQKSLFCTTKYTERSKANRAPLCLQGLSNALPN